MKNDHALPALIAAGLLLSSSPLPAQEPGSATPASPVAACATALFFGEGDLAGPGTDFARAAELAGAAPPRSRLFRRASDEAVLRLCPRSLPVPWAGRLEEAPAAATRGTVFHALPVRWGLVLNTAFADDRNDGALWAGRGVNVELGAGARLRWRGFSAALSPRVVFQENDAYHVVSTVRPPGYSPWFYPWHPGRIDWPQRMGDRHFWTLDPGQSYLRFDADRLTLGLSSENLWWGPAQHNPLLLSNTAPGFPHLFLGTGRPLDVGVGHLEGQVVWGRLAESPYFDGNVGNDRRLFAGFVAGFHPRRLPGLYLGLARGSVVADPPGGLSLAERLLAPFAVQTAAREASGPATYQILGFFARWILPEAGAEVYAEWARRGPWLGFGDLVRAPERGQAYVLGFQRMVPRGGRWIRVYGELAHLTGATDLPRDGGALAFYTDPAVPQGYTHRGQLLGAAIGPGSDGQLLGADLFVSRGHIGAFIERTRRDEDAYYATWTRYYGPTAHDYAVGAGLRGLLHLGAFDLDGLVGYTFRHNRTFAGITGSHQDLSTEANWSVQAGARWVPGRGGARRPAPPLVSLDGERP